MMTSEDGQKALDRATRELQRQAGLLGASAVMLDADYGKERYFNTETLGQTTFIELAGTALLEK